MRLFVFRFNSKILIEVVRKIKRDGHEIAYWSGSKEDYELVSIDQEFKGTVFHNTFDAIKGIGANDIDESDFDSLSADMITNLAPLESTVLSMMNASDLHNTCLSKKKRIYYIYLRYWYGVLNTKKPDAVLFGDIPHVEYQYVVYYLAKMLGIKVLLYRALQVKGRMIFTTDFMTYPELLDQVKDFKHDVSIDELSLDIREYYDQQINPKKDPTPFYMKNDYIVKLSSSYKIFPRFSKIIYHIIHGTFIKTVKYYIQSFFAKKQVAALEGFSESGFVFKSSLRKWANMREKFKIEYEKFQSKVDFSKKYVYLALHNQPECSTSPMGGVFVDQHLMIDILSRNLPKDWLVYVKESPVQWVGPRAHLGRYNGYYEQMAKKSNVVIVPIETSTYDLIENSQAVATVTGTAGWEAILRGKPALVFGYIFYMYCEGVFRVSDDNSCKYAFDRILNNYKIDSQKVINYLKAIDCVSVKSYPNIRFKPEYISEEENIVSISNAFLDMLN